MNLEKLFVRKSNEERNKLRSEVRRDDRLFKIYRSGMRHCASSRQVIYHMFVKKMDWPECPTCGTKIRYVNGYRTYCDRKCMGADPEFRRKVAEAALEGAQDPVKKRKHVLAQRRRWRGELGAQRREVVGRQWSDPAVDAKRRATCMRKYGVAHQSQSEEFRQKYRNTCRERYGVDHPLQLEKFKKKARSTSRKRFGTDYALQNPEIARKQQESAYKRHSTILGGREFSYQGYENFLLAELVDRYGSNRVETDLSLVPSVQYRIGKRRATYFPDVFVPHLNRVYEVKSLYTAGLTNSKFKSYFDKLIATSKACREAELDFWLVVYNGKGERLLNTRLNDSSYKQVRHFLRYGVVGGY